MRGAVVLFAAVVGAVAACSVYASPPIPLTIDWVSGAAPGREVYRANVVDWAVLIKTNGTAYNFTGYTPSAWWATGLTASAVATGTCTIANATTGTFTVRWPAAALNYAPGRYVYGIGLTSNGYATARTGTLTIRADPYATGAAAISWQGLAEADTLASVIGRGSFAPTEATFTDLHSAGYLYLENRTNSFALGNTTAIGYALGGARFVVSVAGDGTTFEGGMGDEDWQFTSTGGISNAGPFTLSDGYQIVSRASLSNLIQSVIDAQ